MNENVKFTGRKSIRLNGYDYASEGLYFLTLCCYMNQHLFGKVIKGQMQLNNAGKVAYALWLEIPKHFPEVKLHDFVVMPNHIHGIIEIVNGDSKVDSMKLVEQHSIAVKQKGLLRSPSRTIGSIVRGYKIGVTKWFRQNSFVEVVWLRNYYEHIIRDDEAYNNISQYIRNNPRKWQEDKFYKV